MLFTPSGSVYMFYAYRHFYQYNINYITEKIDYKNRTSEFLKIYF